MKAVAKVAPTISQMQCFMYMFNASYSNESLSNLSKNTRQIQIFQVDTGRQRNIHKTKPVYDIRLHKGQQKRLISFFIFSRHITCSILLSNNEPFSIKIIESYEAGIDVIKNHFQNT